MNTKQIQETDITLKILSEDLNNAAKRMAIYHGMRLISCNPTQECDTMNLHMILKINRRENRENSFDNQELADYLESIVTELRRI